MHVGVVLVAFLNLFGCQSSSEISETESEAAVSVIKKLNVAERSVSHRVEFEFNSADLPINAAEVVEPHVRFLKSHESVFLLLQGSSSKEGDLEHNHNLALRRSLAVKELFIELGIAGDRILISSVGERGGNSEVQRSVSFAY